jgi:hypothetical protein
MRTSVASGVFIVVALTLAFGQRIDLRPGKYEVTAEMESPDMKMQPHKGTQCITAEQLKDVSKAFLDPEFAKECKVSDLKVDGNKVTFRSDCNQGGVQATGHAEVTFARESYTVVMTTKSSTGHSMTIKQNAKWIAECTK